MDYMKNKQTNTYTHVKTTNNHHSAYSVAGKIVIFELKCCYYYKLSLANSNNNEEYLSQCNMH